jgi:hypothetical protein
VKQSREHKQARVIDFTSTPKARKMIEAYGLHDFLCLAMFCFERSWPLARHQPNLSANILTVGNLPGWTLSLLFLAMASEMSFGPVAPLADGSS